MPNPEIRIYKINERGPVSRATPDKPSGDIETHLGHARKECISGNHALYLINASLPHTNLSHIVGFIGGAETLGCWGGNSWNDISGDTAFLSGLTEYIRSKQDINPQLSVYFVKGFSVPGQPSGKPALYRSLQSLKWGHIHFTEDIDTRLPYQSVFTLSTPENRQRFAYFLNHAGLISLDCFPEVSGIGPEYIYTQEIGITEPYPVRINRNLFISPDLQTGLSSTLDILNRAEINWQNHLDYVAAHSVRIEGSDIRLLQTPTPGAAFIFPSKSQREIMHLPDNFGVLVSPFCVSGPPQILIPGGVIFEWVK
jgi:hypothetical protein